MRIDFAITGLGPLIKKFQALEEMVRKQMANEVILAAFAIEKDARASVAVNTDSLRKSIVAFFANSLNAGVKATAPHASFVEYGTRRHQIRGLPLLSWKDNELGGQRLFARLVQHPGTVARPFLGPAFLRGATRLQARLEQILVKTVNN